MNMNFIAFSSLAKLLDRPHLDAAAAGHGDLDKIYQADGLQNPPAAGFVAADTSLSFRGGRNRQCPRARSRAWGGRTMAKARPQMAQIRCRVAVQPDCGSSSVIWCNSASGTYGFMQQPLAPAASASCASVVLASAVTMRIGIERVRVSSFRRRMTSRPFMP